MEQPKRIKFRCYNCPQEYSVTKILEPDEKPKLFVNCPFCGAPAVVDLNRYRRPSDGVVFRGDTKPPSAQTELILPNPVPTEPAPLRK